MIDSKHSWALDSNYLGEKCKLFDWVQSIPVWFFCGAKLPIGSEIVMNIKFVRPNRTNKTKIEQNNQFQVEFLSSDLSSMSYDQLSMTKKCQKLLVLIVSSDRILNAMLFQMQREAPPA